jgi:hypothetical protein
MYKYLTDGEFVDNIFRAQKYLGLLKAFGAYEPIDGGPQLVIPLQYASNPTVTSSAPWDVIPIQETDEFTAANYDWAQWQGAIALSKMDIAKNSGETQVINLMDAKRKNLEMSVQQDMNTALFNGNVAAGTKTTNCIGLDQICEATGTVGNIDSSVQTWWRSTVESTSASLSESYLEGGFLNAWKNIRPPDLILTTQTLYQKYMDLARARMAMNWVPDPRVADLGFDQAVFKGKPIVFDVDAASGDVYYLDFEYLKLYYHRDFNWEVSMPTELPAQHVLANKIIWIGNQCTSMRRLQGRLRAKTT